MTCIVGITDGKKVYLGGDSFSGHSSLGDIMREPKVFKKGSYLFGIAGEHRTAQIIEYADLPKITSNQDPRKFLITQFIPAIKKVLKAEGSLESENGKDKNSSVALIGLKGRLFSFEGDFSITENDYPYNAIGCGEEYALGAMKALGVYDTLYARGMSHSYILKSALEVASQFSPFVRGPFCFVEG